MNGRRALGASAALACMALVACRGGAPRAGDAAASAERTLEPSDVIRRAGAPPVAVIARDGDPLGALAAALSTASLAPDEQSAAALTLAALMEHRLASLGDEGAVTPTFDGVRIRLLGRPGAPLASAWAALERALTAPVRRDELDAIRGPVVRAIAAARTDAGELSFARCRAQPAVPREASPALAVDSLERWRERATRADSLAFSVVGPAREARALATGPVSRWRARSSTSSSEHPRPSEEMRASRAITHLGRAGLRVRVAMPLAPRGRAVDAARHLSKDQERTSAHTLDLTTVDATVTPHGGCLALETWVDVTDPSTLGAQASARALALWTLARNAARESRASANGWVEARREPDPRVAADVAAWWTLARDVAEAPTVDVTFSPGRDTTPTLEAELGKSLPTPAEMQALLAEGLPRESDASIDLRVRVEAGQGELWVLVGAGCGASADGPSGEGASAVFVTAAAMEGEAGVTLEPYVLADSVAIIAHGPPHEGESSAQLARRVTLAAARAFDAAALEPRDLAQARATLLARATEPDARAFATLAGALAPHSPQSFVPHGSARALARITDGVVHARADALRASVRRIGMLATSTDAQGREGARAVRSTIAARSAPRDTCAGAAAPKAPLAGVWASPRPRDGSARLIVAIVTGDDAAARARADVLAALLDSPAAGLGQAMTSFARAHEARSVRGGARSAVVVTVTTPEDGVDAAFAQLRGYLARLREGALTPSLVELAARRAAVAEVRAQLDPRRRLVALFDPPAAPGPPPSAAELRALLGEERLAVVVSKPERLPSPP